MSPHNTAVRAIVKELLAHPRVMIPLIAAAAMAKAAFEGSQVHMFMFYNELGDKLLQIPTSFETTMRQMLGDEEADRIIKKAKLDIENASPETQKAEALDDVQNVDEASEMLNKLFQKRNTDDNNPAH